MRSRRALYAELQVTRALLAGTNRELTILRRQRARRADSATQTDHGTPSGGSAERSLDTQRQDHGVDAATQTDHETPQGGSASQIALPSESTLPLKDLRVLPADTTFECPDSLEPESPLSERPPLKIVVQKIKAEQARQVPARKAFQLSPTKRTLTAPRKLNQPRKN